MKSNTEMNDNDEFGSKNLIYQKQYFEELQTTPVNHYITLSWYLLISLAWFLFISLSVYVSIWLSFMSSVSTYIKDMFTCDLLFTKDACKPLPVCLLYCLSILLRCSMILCLPATLIFHIVFFTHSYSLIAITIMIINCTIVLIHHIHFAPVISYITPFITSSIQLLFFQRTWNQVQDPHHQISEGSEEEGREEKKREKKRRVEKWRNDKEVIKWRQSKSKETIREVWNKAKMKEWSTTKWDVFDTGNDVYLQYVTRRECV